MQSGFALRKELVDEKQKEMRLARIEALENEIFERAAGVVNAFCSFTEISPDQEDPPAAWIAEFGEEGARQRLRIAKAGWFPQSVMPAGAKISLQAMIGISRGRGYRVNLTKNTLNVRIALPPPTTTENPGPVVYEVRDLET